MQSSWFGKDTQVIVGAPKEEVRMMSCDNCHALTNHRTNEQGEYVCLVCGYNATAALMDDANASSLFGATARLLGQMDKARRYHWLGLLVEALAETCGDETMRELGNILGRRNL